MTKYDTLGRDYASTRRPDPRIAAHIHAALGDAASVVNVGAGAGSYEPPTTRWAVEPSEVMIRQRPAGAAPVFQAGAERIPLPADSADAAMALLTMHHWSDLDAGIAELRRVARKRIVVLTWDPALTTQFWLFRDYLPAAAARDAEVGIPIDELADRLGDASVQVVPIPRDCVDGFAAAFWCRPEQYLDPAVRAGMSVLAEVGDDVLRPGLDRLADDLSSGAWHAHNADLLDLDEFDGGYRLLVAELDRGAASARSGAAS